MDYQFKENKGIYNDMYTGPSNPNIYTCSAAICT